jgi:outer membrane protein OmpA-like peptidoglycan-associated protein
MTTTKTMMITGLALTLGLGGCASMGGRAQLVKTEQGCQDVTVPIYFEPNQAEITRDGHRVLRMAAADAQGCEVQAVQVLGLADAAGEPAANLELSKRRAASVADALLQAKLPAAEFAVAAAGQAGSVTKAGDVQPVRRRADVVLKLAKPKI